MKIDSSHLALRFYPKEGWTRKILEEIFSDVEWNGWWNPKIRDRSSEDTLDGYWVAYEGRILDEEKLISTAEGVYTWKNSYYRSGTSEFLEYVRKML